MDIGKKLKVARKKKKLTQQEVADRLKLDFTSISKHENNKAIPPLKVMVKYSELYDVPIDELFGPVEPTEEEKQFVHDLKKLDIKELLVRDISITWGGKELNEEDKQRFISMAKLLLEDTKKRSDN